MDTIEILQEASKRIYEAVKDMAGTEKAAGDFGRGAGGDISRNIDITAENTVLDYLREINFDCVGFFTLTATSAVLFDRSTSSSLISKLISIPGY